MPFLHPLQALRDARLFSKFFQSEVSFRWRTQTEKGDSLWDNELIITTLICPVSLPHGFIVPGGCLGRGKQKTDSLRKGQMFCSPCHLQPWHRHRHTHTQNIVSPLNLLVVHYDECYVIPLILTSRWLTPMNRLGRPSAAPPHRLMSNQQNTGKLRSSLQVLFRRRSRDPWKVQKELAGCWAGGWG